MKILMVNKFLYPNGGSETYIFKIGEYLRSQGHEVQFFGMEHEGRCVSNHIGAYTADMDFHGGRLKKLLYPFKIIYSLEAKRKMRSVLEDMQPDAVHLNNFNFQLTPSVIYAVKEYEKKTGRRVRILYTAHDYQLVCPNHMMLVPDTKELCSRCAGGQFYHCTRGRCIHGSRIKSILGSMEGYLYKWLGVYRFLDTVICPSYFMKKQLDINTLFAGRTIAMHNFIDRQSTEPFKDEGLSGEDYVLYFGRYSEEKGIRTLLNVCRELPDIPFVFAGSGPLEEEVDKIPNICNQGFRTGEDLTGLIRKARFAVIPSEWYENCPFSVMEAQMYGTPVIGADIGGIPELIQEEQTGVLFESGNQRDLRDKITKLWENKIISSQYSSDCGNLKFDTVEEYCRKLMKLYREET